MDESDSYQNECYTQDGQRVRSSSTMSMHVMTLDANSVHSSNNACSNRTDWQSSCTISVSFCRTPSSTILQVATSASPCSSLRAASVTNNNSSATAPV
ncbi:hypothetical protein ACFX1R_027181 [Malus domestica]